MIYKQYETDFMKYDNQSKPYLINSIKLKKRFTEKELLKIKNNRFIFVDFINSNPFSEENLESFGCSLCEKIYYSINNVDTLDSEQFVNTNFTYYFVNKLSMEIKTNSNNLSIYLKKNEIINKCDIVIDKMFKKFKKQAIQKFNNIVSNILIPHKTINSYYTLQKFKDVEEWYLKFFTKNIVIDKFNYENTNIYDYLNEEQKSVLINSMNNKINFINGGAGTGKSTIAKNIVDNHINQLNIDNDRIFSLAPTGIAVNVLKNKLQGLIPVSNIMTIHRFEHVRLQNNLNIKTIVIDETSMIDISHLTILKKLYDRKIFNCFTNFIFLGDLNQLPPVSIGYFMKAMSLNYNFNQNQLIEIKRQQGGKLLELSKALLTNTQFDYNTLLDDETIINIQHDPFDKTLFQLYEQIIIDFNFDNMEDNMFITTKNNEKNIINNCFQTILNNNNEKINNKFKNDDYICRIKNKYLKDEVTKEVLELYANGDFGILNIKKNNTGDKDIFIHYKDKIEKLDSISDLDEFDLGYCRTIHKSQGDEADNVILYISPDYDYMIQCNSFRKNLIYTALTRAKKKLYIIGDLNKFINCCKHITNIKTIFTDVKQ
jgi:exodeoxyribonuclease V alpha subunit